MTPRAESTPRSAGIRVNPDGSWGLPRTTPLSPAYDSSTARPDVPESIATSAALDQFLAGNPIDIYGDLFGLVAEAHSRENVYPQGSLEYKMIGELKLAFLHILTGTHQISTYEGEIGEQLPEDETTSDEVTSGDQENSARRVLIAMQETFESAPEEIPYSAIKRAFSAGRKDDLTHLRELLKGENTEDIIFGDHIKHNKIQAFRKAFISAGRKAPKLDDYNRTYRNLHK